MPYSYASSTGSQHGTLDGYDISSFVIDPEDQSTRTDIRLRDSAKAYRFWGGNQKAPVNVNSSYIANAFPDFSQSLVSERSVENGRAAKTRQQQQQAPSAVYRKAAQNIRKLSNGSDSDMSRAGSNSLPQSPPRTPPYDRIVPSHVQHDSRPVSASARLEIPGKEPITENDSARNRALSSQQSKRASPEQLENYVSGAMQTHSGGQRRALADIHARVVDETEASFMSDERPTTTFTISSNKSRFQAQKAPRAPSASVPITSGLPNNSFESIAAEFDNDFAKVSTSGSKGRARQQYTITPPDSEKGDESLKITCAPTALPSSTFDFNPANFANSSELPANKTTSAKANSTQMNNTQMSFAMPEIPDISRILNGTYKNTTTTPKPQGVAQPLNTRPRPRSVGAYDSINDLPVPANEKDLYLAIQALQVQVMQLKEEKKQREQTTGAVHSQIDTLNNNILTSEKRYGHIEQELAASKAERAQSEAKARAEIDKLQQTHRKQIEDLRNTHQTEITRLQNVVASAQAQTNGAIECQGQNHIIETEQLKQTHITDIEKVQQRAEAAEALASSLQGEVTKVRKLIVRNKDTEDIFREEIKDLQDENKGLREEVMTLKVQSHKEITRSQVLQEENDRLKEEEAKRQESDSAFGEDERLEVHTLKIELDQAHEEIAQSHNQIHLALTTIERLREEYLKLQQRPQATPVTSERDDKRGHSGDQEDESYDDEPTMRPAQPPGVALREAIERLSQGLAREQALLAAATREYNDHGFGYRGRERKALKERMEMLLAGVEERHEILYDLHDVLESGM